MNAKMRAYWFEKQGLSGTANGDGEADRTGPTPQPPPRDTNVRGEQEFPDSPGFREVLARSGWARSVGGSNPYLTAFSRAGISMADVNSAVANQEVHELPSARGCTYVLPREDYAIGLLVAQGTSDVAPIRTAKKYLGVTDEELERLNKGVLRALESGPMDPKGLRETLGDVVRAFGEEGKKRGQTTSLPLALGWLQTHGFIRRIPERGRLDVERYLYALWQPNPLEGLAMTREDAFVELARKFWRWIGPARLKDFQWFSGLGVGAAKQAVTSLDLVAVEGDFLIEASEEERYRTFVEPTEPCYRLVSAIDSILLLRRDLPSLVEPQDLQQEMRDGSNIVQIGGLADLQHHAILDRGRLVGLWEYDPEQKRIAWKSFVGTSAALEAEVERMRDFARDQLGDVRSFSLDSPGSRRPSIAFLDRS